jgi:acyl-CoA thioesterase-1
MILGKIIIIIYIVIFMMGCKNNNPPNINNENKLENNKKVLIFFGDSLTAGMGLENVNESFPNLLNDKLKKEGYDFLFINAGVSGDTTSGGLTRLDWVLSRGVDYFILELGANDMMRGIPLKEISKNLEDIITKVRQKNGKSKILLNPMKPFPNMGIQYGNNFEKIYKDISQKMNVPLSTFLLKRVAGIRELNQKDGIHPTKQGHEIITETLYPDLLRILK